MTNAQFWLAVCIPTGAICINILMTSRLESRLNIIEGDLRRFWEILGAHGAKIEALERK